jgi:hypothetical protein
MNRALTSILSCWLIFLCIGMAASEDVCHASNPGNPTHVATALNHLTVLEFEEPVSLVAAGGADFQIERQENKVFVKPLKSGVSTNLFVWAGSRRFSYELEPPGEVKDMTFAIDNAVTATKSVSSNTQLDQLADMVLTRAFLGIEQIDNSSIHAERNRVVVRIEQVFRTKNTLYVHYSLENRSKTHYRVASPNAYQLRVGGPDVSLSALQGQQLDERRIRKLHETIEVALPVGHAEAKSEDLASGASSHGVIAIRQVFGSPTVLKLAFDGGIKAVVVL